MRTSRIDALLLFREELLYSLSSVHFSLTNLQGSRINSVKFICISLECPIISMFNATVKDDIVYSNIDIVYAFSHSREKFFLLPVAYSNEQIANKVERIKLYICLLAINVIKRRSCTNNHGRKIELFRTASKLKTLFLSNYTTSSVQKNNLINYVSVFL